MDIATIIVTAVVTLVLEHIAWFILPKIGRRLRGGSFGECQAALNAIYKNVNRLDTELRLLESRKKLLDNKGSEIETEVDKVKHEKDRLLGRLRDLG